MAFFSHTRTRKREEGVVWVTVDLVVVVEERHRNTVKLFPTRNPRDNGPVSRRRSRTVTYFQPALCVHLSGSVAGRLLITSVCLMASPSQSELCPKVRRGSDECRWNCLVLGRTRDVYSPSSQHFVPSSQVWGEWGGSGVKDGEGEDTRVYQPETLSLIHI